MNDKVSVQLGTTSDAENVEVPRELQSDLDGPHWTNGQAGLAISFGDETLTAEQAQDLINQEHLDEHPVGDNNQASKVGYGILAISDADTDVSSVKSYGDSDMDVLSQDFLLGVY